jgi:D-glycero-D-manno-heptose 1,7-bisphosphate phosphatase
MVRAVFLDRDGVINPPALNPASGEWESPHSPGDFELYPWTVAALQTLQTAGYLLFTVSNQPSAAKGKATMEALRAVHDKFHHLMRAAGVRFSEYFYCYHHPQGTVAQLAGPCACRKPKPQFLLQAARQYGLEMAASWMIGDRDSDIQCGHAAGVRTIQIAEPHSAAQRGQARPDYTVATLADAVPLLV